MDCDYVSHTKKCTRCCQELPANVATFRKKPAGKFGLHSICRECERGYLARYRAIHRDELLLRAKVRREANIEYYRERERLVAAKKRAENPAKVYRANYESRRRRLLDPKNRIMHTIRVVVNRCLKHKTKLSKRTFERLGYSESDLRKHIERQFDRNMSWENYGMWHVDHIIPLSSFRFQTDADPEFKACWALSNLRPMWGDENCRKNAKRLYLL